MPCEGPIHIRRASVDDAAGIAAIHMEAWARVHHEVAPHECPQRRDPHLHEAFWREELEVEAHDRAPWVALLDERIVGFVAGGIARDEAAAAATAEVYQLVVAGDCCRRGIRTRLIEHLERDLVQHEFELATFWIPAVDDATRDFAEEQGWRADGGRRFDDCAGVQLEEQRYAHALR